MTRGPSLAAPLPIHWAQSRPDCHPAHITIMLKHKLSKSRKNILSLLDYAQDQEEVAKIPEYSEIKKPGRKDKKKKGIHIQ